MIPVPDFLPLGSIIKLKGNTDKRFIVIGRALAIANPEAENAKEYFDYALALYPEGIVGDAFVYSNHDCITEVIFKGYSDAEDEALVLKVKEVLNQVEGIAKANPTIEDTW